MAPEQATGMLMTPASDWYAVGVMIFQAVTGTLPFTGNNIIDLLVRKQTHEPPRMSALVSGVPEELDTLVHGLLARDPKERAAATEILAWCVMSAKCPRRSPPRLPRDLG